MGYKDAISKGQKTGTYMVCPLCARNRILEVFAKGRLRWDFWDPETSSFVQIREAGGKVPADQQPADINKRGGARGAGFPLKESLTWEEAKELYPDQVEVVRQQLKRLLVLLK